MLDRKPSVIEHLEQEWELQRANFESCCRKGDAGSIPDPDSFGGELTRAFEEMARKEFRAIRDRYIHSDDLPTIDKPAVDTRDRKKGETPQNSTTNVAASPVRSTSTMLPKVEGYEIQGVLGHGGMGVVYKARHLALDREVALKMILAGEHASPAAVQRFLTEARAVARLNHPNIVQIYQIDEHAGMPSFALEFCARGSLDRQLNKQPLSPAQAAEYTETLARALQTAHDAGVIHRDIKPSNVLVSNDGSLKITDFGLARMATDDSIDRTGTGAILGSPPYMSPEQASGSQDRVGPRSDQYSLGATLYEFLTGAAPFRGPTSMDTVRQVIDREPVPPSTLQPGVPKDLETICLKALSKDPAKRYSTAAAMADDLRAFREGRPISARPVGPIEKLRRWAKRNPRVAGLLAIVATLLAALASGGAAFAVVYRDKAIEAENNFREAEARGAKLTAALDQSEKNLQESNENYAFAREVSVTFSQKLPAVLQSRVADSAARRDIGDLIAQSLLQRKGGSVRQLPDRVLFTVTLQKADNALERRDLKTANEEATVAMAIAERMRATEPVEFDKADGHYARALQKLSYLHLRASQLSKDKAEIETEKAAGRGYIDRAVELSRQRVKSPRSNELEAGEREMNLAEFVAMQSRFEEDPEKAEAMMKEAITLATAIAKGKDDKNSLRFLAGLHYQYSDWLRDHQRREDRKAALEKAVAGMTEYQKANPDDVDVRMTLGEWNRELGDMIFLGGDRVGPMPFYRTAYDLLRPLARTPQALTMQKDFAADSYRAGLAALEAKEAKEAERQFRSSFRVAEETMDRGKVTYELLNLAALAAARCGEYRRAKYWIERLEAQTKWEANQLIEAACCTATLAGCIDTSPDTAHLAPEMRAELKAKTVASAIKLLTEWRDVLNSPANEKYRAKNMASFVRRLNTEPDLDGLRAEATFKAFVQDTTEPR